MEEIFHNIAQIHEFGEGEGIDGFGESFAQVIAMAQTSLTESTMKVQYNQGHPILTSLTVEVHVMLGTLHFMAAIIEEAKKDLPPKLLLKI